jgi:hypothetical protein
MKLLASRFFRNVLSLSATFAACLTKLAADAIVAALHRHADPQAGPKPTQPTEPPA